MTDRGEELKALQSILATISPVFEAVLSNEGGPGSVCTLMVGGGEKLKAHRLVLSAISPVFEHMFSSQGFQEATDGIVHIEDFAVKPCRALLVYAYHGWIDWAAYGDCKRDVLRLACKYLVDGLKEHVEGLLAREITVETFAELALLADSYSCKHLQKACLRFLTADYPQEDFADLVLLANANSCDYLKRACIKYLRCHFRAVVSTSQWMDLTETRRDLALELLRLEREGKITAEWGTEDQRDDDKEEKTE